MVRGVDIEGNVVAGRGIRRYSRWTSRLGGVTKTAEERRTNACCFRYRVCNGRRCSIFRTVACECVAEEEYAGGKNRRECSEDSLKLPYAVDLLRKKDRVLGTAVGLTAVLLFC